MAPLVPTIHNQPVFRLCCICALSIHIDIDHIERLWNIAVLKDKVARVQFTLTNRTDWPDPRTDFVYTNLKANFTTGDTSTRVVLD